MILPTAILVSHLAGAPALAPFQPEPVELERARQLMVSKPSECITLTHLFLQREEQTVQQRANSRHSLNHPRVIPHYRTPEQTQKAWQTQALCQANIGQLDKAQRVLDKAIKRAQREQLSSAEAASLIIKAKLALAQQDIKQANTLFEQASTLLTTEAPNALMDALMLLQSNIFLHQGQYEQTRHTLEQLRLHTQEQGRPRLQAWSNYFLAENYLAQQQQELALAHYLETLSLLDNQQHYLKAITAEKAASLHAALDKAEQAIFYANLATTEFERLGNSQLLIGSLLSLGKITRQGEEADLALVYLFNALGLATQLDERELVSQLYLEIGTSYRKLEMYPEASSYLSQARNRFRHSQDQPRLIDTLVQFGQVHLAQQEYGLALLHLDKARELANELDDASRLVAVHQQLALLFEASNNPKQALLHQQAYHHYYVQARQVNPLSNPEVIQSSDPQLQQTRELASMRQQYNVAQQERRNFSRAVTFLSLLLPLCLYGWHHSRRRCQQLEQQNNDLQYELLTEHTTGLPNWRQLMQRLPEDMAKSQLRSEQWYLSETQIQPFNDRVYYLLLQVPFMVNLSERIGLTNSNALQKELGVYLQGRLHPQAQLYDVRDGQFIYVISQRHVSSLSHTIDSLVRTFAEFPSSFELDTRLSIGIVGHPFLSKAPHALDDVRLGDILFLALAAARQLSLQTQEVAWIELLALDCQQAAFFTGDIRYCSIEAILKGLVKVNSSHPKQPIDWPSLVFNLKEPL